MVDTRHDLSITVYELEAIENDDFHENVKYLISQKLLDIRLGANVLGTSVLWYSSTDFAVLVGTRYSYF